MGLPLHPLEILAPISSKPNILVIVIYFLFMAYGVLARPLPLFGPGEVRLRTSIVRLDLERSAKVVDGAVEVALLGQGNAQVIVRRRWSHRRVHYPHR